MFVVVCCCVLIFNYTNDIQSKNFFFNSDFIDRVI